MSYTNGLDKPTEYFNTLTYTGDGVSPKGITGVGFQPDLVWIKNRGTTNYHLLQDVVRGVTSTNVLSSNDTTAEPSFTNIGFISSFNSDGFTATSSGGSLAVLNASGNNYVSWNWKANGAGVSNTDGTITSTVSANTTAGFSIVSYTGTGANATVGHGLGVAPKMIIFKNRDTVTDWDVYVEPIGAGKRLYLNTTGAEVIATNYMNDTAPTSTLFSVGVADNTNKSGSPQIAYCFADVKGYSKFGSYTGNGNADGTFVYTGFKPAFIMTKRTNSTGSWEMFDAKRIGYNVSNYYLYAQATNVEATDIPFDILSNGFKRRHTGASNASGGTNIYMCFAENPFVTSSGIPATAR
jgi:hypothetical protein